MAIPFGNTGYLEERQKLIEGKILFNGLFLLSLLMLKTKEKKIKKIHSQTNKNHTPTPPPPK